MHYKVFLIIIAFCFIGCAEPKYIQGTNQAEQNQGQEAEADCSVKFQTSKLCLQWYWEVKPTDSTSGSFIFKVFRLNLLDNSSIEADLEVTPVALLWMPSMGHGSSPTTVTKIDTGTYRASNVFFVMPGEWEIKFQVKNGNVVSDEAVVSLTF